MRGHIIKRYKDSYTIVLTTGKDPSSGKPMQQWISIKGTKKDAEKRLAELLHQMDTGNYTKPGKVTVGEYLERWLNDSQPNLSPRGFERYKGIVKQHLIPALGSMKLTQLRPEQLQKHYTAKQEEGLSPRTVRYHHAVLHVALKTAVQWGLIPRNPADAVTIPRIRRTEMQTWGEHEIVQFIEAAKGSRYYVLVYTALFTGMRRSELLGLKWGDVDLMMGQIYVSRGLHHLKNGSYVFTETKSAKSRRTIALPPTVTLLLKEHLEQWKLEGIVHGVPSKDDDLVFCTQEGKPLRPNTVTRAWTILAKKAGLKVIRLHDARHTHASIMLKQGIHPKIVQERLGHSSIQMTLDTYSHVAPGLQEAAAVRFDEFIVPKRANEAVRKID